jgi:hypothetical protein
MTLIDQLIEEWSAAADRHRALGQYGAHAGPLQECLDGLVTLGRLSNGVIGTKAQDPIGTLMTHDQLTAVAKQAALDEFAAVGEFIARPFFDSDDDLCVEIICKFTGAPMIDDHGWNRFRSRLMRAKAEVGDNRFLLVTRG